MVEQTGLFQFPASFIPYLYILPIDIIYLQYMYMYVGIPSIYMYVHVHVCSFHRKDT